MPRRVPTLRPRGPHDARTLYDGQASRAEDKRFYASARWVRTRRYKLSIDPLCEDCKRQGRITAAVHVHHVAPRKTRPDLAFTASNLESLCLPCHNAQDTR